MEEQSYLSCTKADCNNSDLSSKPNNCVSEKNSKSKLLCPRCDEEFSSGLLLLEHLQCYSGGSKTCDSCHQEFNNAMAFKIHKQLKICGKLKMYKCKLCSKTLYGSSQYSTHIIAHKRNQCKRCGCHFSTKKHLRTHNLNVHNESLNKDLFRCGLCERTFTQRRSLVYHYKITHPGDCNICPVCLEMFDSSESLETHEATHKRHIFTCPKCNQQFFRKKSYLIHLNEHDKYRCEDCQVGFSTKKVAERHARMGHVVNGLSQQQCAVCGQIFCSRGLLRSHVAVHHSGQIFACEKCKVTFKNERNYLNHLETNEHLRGEEPTNLLACKVCNKTFLNKNNLRAHVSRNHNASLKEHSCTLCSYKTTFPTNLKRHMTLHTQEPQFICEKCAAKFQTKSALQEHIVGVHSGHKEFSCDKCGNQFNRRSDLNRHLLNTHSDTAQYACPCGNKYRTLSSLKRHQLMTHSSVDAKQQRLSKMFPTNIAEPKKRPKRIKKKTNPIKESDNKLLTITEVSDSIRATSSVVMTPETHPVELIPYNIDFEEQIIEDKNQVVYTEDLDIDSFQVVEPMLQLGRGIEKEGPNVMINVRNLFDKPGPNNYCIHNAIETCNLDGCMAVTDQKHDLIASLQDYIIPNDLNFLNV